MEYAEYTAAVDRECAAFVIALAEGTMDALVPTCEGWKVADLASHVGDFCGFWTHVLCEGTGRAKTPFSEAPEGDDVVPWMAELAGHLVDELGATPATTEVWTWFPDDRRARFVARRCANELAVHRTDMQAARGTHTPIAADLAVDGIDEVFDRLLSVREHGGAGTGRTLSLIGYDTPSAWRVTLGRDGIGVERPPVDAPELAASNLVVTASASDLEFVVYARPTLSPVEMEGDYTVLDEWHRDFTF
jgi:uncharacterized protein (TIGR03083 family)